MKKTLESSEKKVYSSPQIERIALDNEISLALTSPEAPPIWAKNQDNHNNDLFKSNVG